VLSKPRCLVSRDADCALLFSFPPNLGEELAFLPRVNAEGNAASALWLDLCAMWNNDSIFMWGSWIKRSKSGFNWASK
jgi:hypothetical protein